MLAGEPPYTGPTAQALIAKRLSVPVPHLRTFREDLPLHIERAVRKALAKVPADRFATAAEFQAVLVPEAPAGAGDTVVSVARAGGFCLTLGTPPGRSGSLDGGRGGGGPGPRLVRAPRSPRGTPPAAALHVAVLPFAYHGGAEAKQLSGAMVNLLGTVLDGAGGLHTVDVAAVLTAAGDEKSFDRSTAPAIAQRLGAGRYILGDVVEGAPGKFTVSASVYGADSGDGKRAAVEGSGSEVFRLVNELAVQLLGSLGVQQSPRRLESMSTSSTVALNEYLNGEASMRRGDYPKAVEAFGRAVQADSLFALAWFRQAYAYGFTEEPERAEQPLARALALRDRLSERDRRLAEALGALVGGDPERAVKLYSALVYEYPDDVEGWFGRADAVLHFGPLYGLRMDSVSQAFERVLYLDPNHSEAEVHLPWTAGLDASASVSSTVPPAGSSPPIRPATTLPSFVCCERSRCTTRWRRPGRSPRAARWTISSACSPSTCRPRYATRLARPASPGACSPTRAGSPRCAPSATSSPRIWSSPAGTWWPRTGR